MSSPRAPEIDFAHIAPRCGSKDDAFEELCCQLALDSVESKSSYRRVHGAGGDGGVECTWEDDSGAIRGWQVKYIFDIGQVITKVRGSFTTARTRYPALSRYTICIPFDLAGSKGRRGKSQQEKFEALKEELEAEARAAGMTVVVDLWSASNLRQRLLDADPHGGRTRYWFDASVLDEAWFSRQIRDAVLRAGPRYSPELHHGHVLDEAISALSDDDEWSLAIAERLSEILHLTETWDRALACGGSGGGDVPFPPSSRDNGDNVAAALQGLAAALRSRDLGTAAAASENMLETITICESALVADLDDRFGKGKWDSPAFRQYQAEYQCTFPARHVDDCREILAKVKHLSRWLSAPHVRAAAHRTLVVSGPAGIGKTHGLCDAVRRRDELGRPSVLLTGRQFDSPRSVWESITGALGLGADWSRDTLLDALDAAGTQHRVILFVDALDERVNRTRWRDELPEVVAAIRTRPNLALCVAVRDGYQGQTLREDLGLPCLIHPGFGADVFDACSSFFEHFELEPPVGPLLEPEYANPLFLKVLCQTLKARGLRSVPVGWTGASRVLGRLLSARDEELKSSKPGTGSRTITRAMEALASALTNDGGVPWNDADDLVNQCLPASQRGSFDLLDHLIGIGLVQVIPGEDDGWEKTEDRIDIAFGRLRHHLVASALTSTASDTDLLQAAIGDSGIAEALALVFPERRGKELLELTTEADERDLLMEAWLRALPWRSPDTLRTKLEPLLLEALNSEHQHDALDALLVLAMRPGHELDHRHLHAFLLHQPMPARDAGWCGYLHSRFAHTSRPSPLDRLLRAPWESSLSGLPDDLREAWCVVLAWCCAAADRRVRDAATKAAIRVAEDAPRVWSDLVRQFADVDDDYVLERVLAAAFGTVIRNPDSKALSSLAVAVHETVLGSKQVTLHALARDYARSIGEWAVHRGVLLAPLKVESFRPPFRPAASPTIPDKSELEKYRRNQDYPQLYESVMSDRTGDFAKYTMTYALGDLAKLIGVDECRRWVLAEVMRLGYTPERHAPYDYLMLREHGPGRGRPAWAERIGKKYQHIALARLVGMLDDLGRASSGVEEELAGMNLRDIDPTTLVGCPPEEDPCGPWWAPASMDFEETGELGDAEWVGGDDFPDASVLASSVSRIGENRKWRLLHGYYTWSQPRREDGWYRDVWMMIKGYVVPRALLEECVTALRTCDFMGRWMVEEREFHGVFMGEYPWMPALDSLRSPRESWSSGAKNVSRFNLTPVANRLMAQDDSWTDDGPSVTVPSAALIEETRTRWNGVNGFQTDDGTTVAVDPSVVSQGPSCLMMDEAALQAYLEANELALVWTVLAERRIIGDHGDDFCGMKHVSAVMWLDGEDVRYHRAVGEHIHPDRTRTAT